MNYRSTVDIIAMILFTAVNGERKSSIMSRAHLNYRQIKKYIKILVVNGLVIERSNLTEGSTTYQTTDKGKNYLEMYEESKAYNLTSNTYVFGKQTTQDSFPI
ncbi:MAG TPA: winged helix-turn-helix domain-containing protein [Nitrososphaeraceae archaeon]|nr:winged helix-turn-helix domain-containing protein [Nitrososphaeraceae archaeon]